MTFERRTQVDFQELGYAPDDVHRCLAALRPSDYRGVAEYNGVQFDVYHPHFPGPSGHVDELYVKLAERPQATLSQVLVVSFHLQRKG